MNEENKFLPGLFFVAGLWLVLSMICFFKPSAEASESERRKLNQMPEINMQSVMSGSFMSDFEKYTLDQFPFRDSFRTIKAVNTFYVFRQKDNNGIYISDGYAAKLEYPLKEEQAENAANKFWQLYNNYMKDTDVKPYISIVPDKGYFLADKNGYPSMDYNKLISLLKESLTFAEYIDITDTLQLEDYYKTDTHWKQEKIIETAQKLALSMGAEISGKYSETVQNVDFYGVYYGQSALPLAGETITTLSNKILDGCMVYNAETGKTTSLYDMDKLLSRDPYEVYLSGAASILYIDNPAAQTEKELVVFRDSFGSSIVPLICEGYSKITLIDTRYVSTSLVGDYVTFDNQDVLFLYSTIVLNNSSTLK